MESILQVIVFLTLIKCLNLLYIYIYIYIQKGIIRISFKTLVFYHIDKYRVIAHVVLKYVEKITIALLIPIHTKTLSAIAMKNT